MLLARSEEEQLLGVEVVPAIVAGLIAGAVMEGPVYLQKALRLPVKQNIFRTWGLLFGQRGAAGYVIGVLFHQLLAAVIAVGYAVFFRLIGVDGSVAVGPGRRAGPLHAGRSGREGPSVVGSGDR